MQTLERNLERALRDTGQRVAVDRQKVALIGECNGGDPVHRWGFHNLELFSRIGTISGELWDDSTMVVSRFIPRTTSTQFYVQESIVGGEDAARAYRRVRALRANGNTVTYVVSGHGHGGDPADFMLLGRWLSESWRHATMAPVRKIDTPPVLTTDAVAKVTAVLAKFAQEGAPLRTSVQSHDTKELTVPVGGPSCSASILRHWRASIRRSQQTSRLLA